MTALIVVACLILAGNIAAGIAGVVTYRRISAQIRALVTPAVEGELSPFAQITHALAQDFARTLMFQLKASLSVPAAHIARQEGAITQELTQAAINEQAPQWGALLGLLPKSVQARVLKNPAAAAALIGLLGKMGSGSPAGGSAGSGSGNGQRSSVQLRLRNLV